MNDELLNIIDDDITLEEEASPDVLVHVIPGSDMALSDAEEEDRETDWENDGDHSKFLAYLSAKINAIPKHQGHTTVGVERAIGYLKKLDSELSKAIRSDDKNVIDEIEAEDIRDKIYVYIRRLQKAFSDLSDKKHNVKEASLKISSSVYSRIGPNGDPMFYIRAGNGEEETLLPVSIEEPTDLQVQAYMEWEQGKFKKEASSARIVLMADPFLHEVTNIIIRSHVTYGRNIENVYRDLAKKYEFSNRDHLAVHSLLREKGLLLDRDLSRLGEEVEISNQSVGLKSYPA